MLVIAKDVNKVDFNKDKIVNVREVTHGIGSRKFGRNIAKEFYGDKNRLEEQKIVNEKINGKTSSHGEKVTSIKVLKEGDFDAGRIEVITEKGEYTLQWAQSISGVWDNIWGISEFVPSSHKSEKGEINLQYDPQNKEFECTIKTASGNEHYLKLNSYVYEVSSKKQGYLVYNESGYSNTGLMSDNWAGGYYFLESISSDINSIYGKTAANSFSWFLKEVKGETLVYSNKKDVDSVITYLSPKFKGFSESVKKLVEMLPSSVSNKNGSVAIHDAWAMNDVVGFMGDITVTIGSHTRYDIDILDDAYEIKMVRNGYSIYSLEGSFSKDYHAFCEFLTSIQPQVQKIYNAEPRFSY